MQFKEFKDFNINDVDKFCKLGNIFLSFDIYKYGNAYQYKVQ